MWGASAGTAVVEAETPDKIMTDDVLSKNTSNFILTSALILLFYRSGSAARLLMTCAQHRVTRFNWSIANHQCEFHFNKNYFVVI